MLSVDENALICDLAETYNIYDYRRLPVKTVAAFSVGLRGNSRIKMKINGEKLPLDTSIMILLLDSLNNLRYELSGKKGKKPKSIYSMINEELSDKEYETFDSSEEFEERRRKLLRKEYKDGN